MDDGLGAVLAGQGERPARLAHELLDQSRPKSRLALCRQAYAIVCHHQPPAIRGLGE